MGVVSNRMECGRCGHKGMWRVWSIIKGMWWVWLVIERNVVGVVSNRKKIGGCGQRKCDSFFFLLFRLVGFN